MSGGAVGVTGTSGFVGGTVAGALSQAGHRVIALGRRPVPPYEYRPYELSTGIVGDALAGVETVVHCAYDLSLTDSRTIATTNVEGTRALVRAVRAAGCRLILVSSMSAYPGTRQVYGRAKLRSEKDVLEAGGDVVRLGLVWGGAEGGMIGTLKRLARLPVVPVFGRDSYQFTVHADDMAAGFVTLVGHPSIGEPLGLAHPARTSFERIITQLGDGRRPMFLRVPWRPTYALMRSAELARVPLPVRADSLLGLVEPAPSVPNAEVWPRLGLRLRAFAELDRVFPHAGEVRR
jgi:nucleoside-diphosphate-sugar epimerase